MRHEGGQVDNSFKSNKAGPAHWCLPIVSSMQKVEGGGGLGV